MFSKGAAGVVISGPTSLNTWSTGVWTYNASIFEEYANYASQSLGGTKSNVFFVRHGKYTAQAQLNLGREKVDVEGYINDNTHTQPVSNHYPSSLVQSSANLAPSLGCVCAERKILLTKMIAVVG